MYIEISDFYDPADKEIAELQKLSEELSAERQKIWLTHIRSGYNGGTTQRQFFNENDIVKVRTHDWRQVYPMKPFGLVCITCDKKVMDPFGTGKEERQKHDCNETWHSTKIGFEAVERLEIITGILRNVSGKITRLKKAKTERIKLGVLKGLTDQIWRCR